MTRTEKYKSLRYQLEKEKDALAKKLLITANDLTDVHSEIMDIHSDISRSAFDRMMGDPISQFEKISKISKEDWNYESSISD